MQSVSSGIWTRVAVSISYDWLYKKYTTQVVNLYSNSTNKDTSCGTNVGEQG